MNAILLDLLSLSQEQWILAEYGVKSILSIASIGIALTLVGTNNNFPIILHCEGDIQGGGELLGVHEKLTSNNNGNIALVAINNDNIAATSKSLPLPISQKNDQGSS